MKNAIMSLALGAAVGFVLAGPAAAHHAVQASVDVNQTISASAVLTKIDWINPHTWLHFDVTLANGTVEQNVLIESLGIAALKTKGIDSKSALKVGDTFKIEFNPNRNGEPGGFLSKMVFPDGKTFEVSAKDPIATQ